MRTRPTNERGNILIAVLLGMALLTGFTTVAFNYTSGNARIAQRSLEMNGAYAVADGALELIYSRWRIAMRGAPSNSVNYTPADLTTQMNNPLGIDITRSMNDSSQWIDPVSDLGMPADTPYRINYVTITRKDVYGRPQPDDAAIDIKHTPETESDPVYLSDKPGSRGFLSWNIFYEVKVWVTSTLHGSVDANGNVTGNPITICSSRRFTKSLAPSLQAAIFFENQLELFPGSNMTVDGLVHTNDNLYAGGVNGSKLDFLKDVSYTGFYNADANGTRAAPQAMLDAMQMQSSNITDPLYKGVADPGDARQRVGRMNIGGIDPDAFHGDNSGNPDPVTNKPLPVNYNDDSLREIIERPVRPASSASLDPSQTPYNDYYGDPDDPDSPTYDPKSIASQRIYNQASLKILMQKNSVTGKMDITVRGLRPEGMADGPDMSTVNSKLVQDISKAINATTSGTRIQVHDLREGDDGNGPVAVSTLDISKLRDAIAKNMKSTDPTDPNHFNGILYISDTTGADSATGSYNDRVTGSGTPTDVETVNGARVKHGIMLVNGEKLPGYDNNDYDSPDRAFTVASDNAVYIKGDYNTGGTGNQVPSNIDQSLANAKADYKPVNASVMADAVAVVSSKFDPTVLSSKGSVPGLYDTYQSTDKTADYYVPKADPRSGTLVRGATPTTVNTAVVSGILLTNDTDGTASGGAHNLIRLLENWSDSTTYDALNFTYTGALMQSYVCKEFSGSWSKTFYNNPQRKVSFDQNFIAHPPAGSPVVITYSRGKWDRHPDPVPHS